MVLQVKENERGAEYVGDPLQRGQGGGGIEAPWSFGLVGGHFSIRRFNIHFRVAEVAATGVNERSIKSGKEPGLDL